MNFMSNTVLAKKHQGHITWITLENDNKKEEIKRLRDKQGYIVLATGKPESYTVKDAWLEYNVNDMVLTIK